MRQKMMRRGAKPYVKMVFASFQYPKEKKYKDWVKKFLNEYSFGNPGCLICHKYIGDRYFDALPGLVCSNECDKQLRPFIQFCRDEQKCLTCGCFPFTSNGFCSNQCLRDFFLTAYPKLKLHNYGNKRAI